MGNSTKIYKTSIIEKAIIERFKDCDSDYKYYFFKGCLLDGIEIIEKMLDILKMDADKKENAQHCLFLCNLLCVELGEGKPKDKLVEKYVKSNNISWHWTDSDELMASAIKVYCDYYNGDESHKIKQIILDKKMFDEGFSKEDEIELEKKIIYAYFENKEYEKVIEVSKNFLEKDPKETYFYFETIQAYIQLGLFDEAKAVIRILSTLISDDLEKARLYRMLGYINIEINNLKLAMACYRYSLLFDDNSLAVDEIKYIILQDSGIPLYDKAEMETILRDENLLYF